MTFEALADDLKQYGKMSRRIRTIDTLNMYSDNYGEGWREKTRAERKRLVKRVELLNKLCACLCDDERELIEALYIKGMTYDRASEVLDVSRATVTARRRRAIEHMIEMLNIMK